MSTSNDIIFFRFLTDEYGSFSNFAPYPFTAFYKVWPSSEHYYQAMKFDGVNMDYAERIRLAKTPASAAKLGRDPSMKMRADWDQVVGGVRVKDRVMRQALRHKFTAHDRLRLLLVSTGDRWLVERSNRDSYWGDGKDRQGLNRLGELLMELRTELSLKPSLLTF